MDSVPLADLAAPLWAMDGDSAYAAAVRCVRDDVAVRFPVERRTARLCVLREARLFDGHRDVATITRRSDGDGTANAHVVVPAFTQSAAPVDVAAVSRLLSIGRACCDDPAAAVFLALVDAGGAVTHLRVEPT